MLDDLSHILDDARTLYKECEDSDKKPSWSDYEYFKRMMHDNNIYGHEGELIDVLHL